MSKFANPTEECDLVMKGGITSGIVYSPVILQLAQRYKLRNLAGTSAGAIAASLASAAEYGRSVGGFEKLGKMSQQIGQPGFLLGLFQPTKETQPLLDTLFELFNQYQKNQKNPTATERGILYYIKFFHQLLVDKNKTATERGAKLGLGVGLLISLLLSFFSFFIFWLSIQLIGVGSISGWNFVFLLICLTLPLAILGNWLGELLVGTYDLGKILLNKVPDNFFGLCNGRQYTNQVALTDWLNEQINDIAGLEITGKPLTFGDLKNQGIELKMVTSNISHNQPYNLPFDAHNIFIFNQAEFRILFPNNIVDHLMQYAPERSEYKLPDQGNRDQKYFFLPHPEHLPVIIATRLSLSYPLLISGIPIYTISQLALERKHPAIPLQLTINDLQFNLFSDGGIASNFPIHFFDAWLPKRPTFGINLSALPQEAFSPEKNCDQVKTAFISLAQDQPLSNPHNQSVYLPRADTAVYPEWYPIKDLASFLNAVLNTGLTYRDNTQSKLPSYRERIINIRLSDEEGGLNLSMSPETIKYIVAKGDLAGQILLNQFNLNHHQWVRFRVLMELLERQLKEMKDTLQDLDDFNYIKLTKAAANPKENYPYPCDLEEATKIIQAVEQMKNLINQWDKSLIMKETSPLPQIQLRVTPDV